MIFSGTPWKLEDVLHRIYHTHDDIVAGYRSSAGKNNDRLLAHWSPPPTGTIKINTDGSFKEESDLIRSGGLVRADKGESLHGFYSFDGVGDVLLAELMGIYHGLVLADHLGFKNVICESDCLHVVELLNNRKHHEFHHHASLLGHITRLLDGNWSVSIVHCFREQNACADYLAKLGVNSSGFNMCVEPPTGLGALLLQDALAGLL